MRPSRRDAMKVGLGGAAAFVAGGIASAADSTTTTPSIHCDHILGTSLDIQGQLPSSAESTILNEIERLRSIFSVHDANSELMRLNSTTAPVAVSSDLRYVLMRYESWHQRTGNALNGNIGALMQAWKAAEQLDSEPSAPQLAELVRQSNIPGWHWDASTSSVTRTPGTALNLNSVAKGYILDQIARVIPTASPLIINLGGDIAVRGSAIIAVQDPANPAENTKPLTVLKLTNASIATSGGYQRGFTIDGTRRSHLIDPRTGRPADAIQSATVVASNSETANALATACCILSPAESLALVTSIPGAACLIVTATGEMIRNTRFAELELPCVADAEIAPDNADNCADNWPADYQVKVELELPKVTGSRYRRPYVAVWFENADGKAVRTLEVWGNSRKYWKDLSGWWKFARGDDALISAVTRATRGPGKYELIWDGKDDKGKPLPQGKYTVFVEVHREHGKHLTQTGKIECTNKDATLKLTKNAETEDTTVTFGKSKKQ